MPKSLETGASKIVPVKMPESEKQAAIAACKDGETLSAFVRDAVKREVKRRKKNQPPLR